MHILFVTHADGRYGEYHSLLGLIKSLKEIDHDLKISVVSPKRFGKREEIQQSGCDVYYIPFEAFLQGIPDCKLRLAAKRIIRGLQYLAGRLFALRILERQLDLHTVDLVHANVSQDDFGAAIAAKYHKPLIWHIRGFNDLDYPSYSCRHNYIEYMNRHAAVFIAVSEAVKQRWIGKGIDASKIIRIYDGIDEMTLLSAAGRKPKATTGKDRFRLVMVGAVLEGKGQRQIIEAISRLPDSYKKRFFLDVVGDGNASYMKKIKKLVKKHHLEDRIRFLGYRENFFSQLSTYDCGVMCSRCEGFGLVTIEYMTAGLPVLASDTGANPELIEDGVTGLFYHYPDTEDLKNKLIYVSEHREKVKEMGTAAQTAGMEYTAIKNAREIYQLYKKFAGEANDTI